MKATTIWQPFASLIAIKAKPFETRDYAPPTNYIGQRIAIHAAIHPPVKTFIELKQNGDFETICAINDALAVLGIEGASDWNELPTGAVLCTAILAAAYHCGPMDEDGKVFVTRWLPSHEDPLFIQSDPFGNFSQGRWAWKLSDVQQLEKPVPAAGKQNWWGWAA